MGSQITRFLVVTEADLVFRRSAKRLQLVSELLQKIRGFTALVGREGVNRSCLVLVKIRLRPRLSYRARSGWDPSPEPGAHLRHVHELPTHVTTSASKRLRKTRPPACVSPSVLRPRETGEVGESFMPSSVMTNQ